MPFATDEEIRIAHDILLKGKKPFDAQRIDIIKEDGSCYVQACPGSGKTTALLTKLIILANKMPLPDGKGVCVLTHTNVAIDEIKARVGQKADVLFKYPNFFGTIQTFLHKYVTAAALHYFYGSQIAYVDDDVAKAVLLKKFCKLPFKNKLRGFVFNHIVARKHPISNDTISALGGAGILVSTNVIKNIGKKKNIYDFQLNGYDKDNIPKSLRSSIYDFRNNILENEGREIILSFRVDWCNNQILTDQKPISIESESGYEYVRIKEDMFKEGILSFDDAYDLAFRYIQEKGLDFSNFSDKRFKYLFIDEVQDCDKKQVELIKTIFDDDKVIVQRFGDYCQAIYDNNDNDSVQNEELRDKNVLYIRDSNRFGEKIAKPLRSLCMEDNSLLIGNGDVPSIKPIIITYNDPLSVLPKYVEILNSSLIPEMDNLSVLEIANRERLEDPLHRLNVKACGWVGKKASNEQKRFIESYFPMFEKKNDKIRLESSFFNDYIIKKTNGSTKDYAISIIQGILKYLDLCGITNGNRRYTRTSLLDFLAKSAIEIKDSFLSNVMDWALLVVQDNNIEAFASIKEKIHQYIIGIILPLFKIGPSSDAENFFWANIEDSHKDLAVHQGNIYHADCIDIEIATVHSIKGETHAATLYLETFYNRQHESERLADQFKGTAYMKTDVDTRKNLRVAYVGMSRPRYMLCVAIQKDRFDKIDSPELREIWDVKEV